MPRYTMRLCWPGEVADDYQFFVNGKAAGRCYLMRAAGHREVWRWTLYGSSAGGMEDTLEEAQRLFKESYQRAVDQWKDKHLTSSGRPHP